VSAEELGAGHIENVRPGIEELGVEINRQDAADVDVAADAAFVVADERRDVESRGWGLTGAEGQAADRIDVETGFHRGRRRCQRREAAGRQSDEEMPQPHGRPPMHRRRLRCTPDCVATTPILE